MAIFNFNKKTDEKESQSTEIEQSQAEKKESSEIIQLIEKPRICCFDLEEQTIDKLQKSGANIFEGTLGAKIKVPNTRNKEHRILLNYLFPSNLHEFDIIILDLQNSQTIEWKETDHIRENHTGKESFFLISSFPETLFNPKPLSASILKSELNEIKRTFIVIVFSAEKYEVEYDFASISNEYNYYNRKEPLTENIYSFWHNVPLSKKLVGKEIKLADLQNPKIILLLDKYKTNAVYHQTFHHPTKWEEKKSVLDENFIPLMTNLHDDIISFVNINDNGHLFVFPQIEDKANFLLDFLSDFAPTIFPEVFPYSSKFKWKEEKEYWLPNHSRLLENKEEIKKSFEKQIEEIDLKIQGNQSEHLFLQELITETDDALVKSIIEFLKWLGFNKVHFVDDTKSESSVKEEDIQVELPNGGLLVIECKGIGGTSTDSDCSQIHKIKYRRSKERKKFDVYALYIVNHQRFLPPLRRKNPPFTQHQIQDAENDERGLLSTWQLFNLFFDIENNIITKEEARQLILDFGLVDFRPKNLVFIDKPKEIFKKGKVCIVNIDDKIFLEKNDVILVEKNERFSPVKIIEIRDNDQQVERATNGEFGLRLGNQIQNNSVIWKKVKD
jgi:hypothetical protein